MGFAVLMFGMSTMSAAVSPLRDDPTFIRILTSFSNPFLGILFGTLFTCVPAVRICRSRHFAGACIDRHH